MYFLRIQINLTYTHRCRNFIYKITTHRFTLKWHDNEDFDKSFVRRRVNGLKKKYTHWKNEDVNRVSISIGKMSITTKTDSASLHIQSGWSLLPCKKTPHNTYETHNVNLHTHTNTDEFYQIYIQNAYIPYYTHLLVSLHLSAAIKPNGWQSKEDKNTQDWRYSTYMYMWHKKKTTTTAVRVLSRIMCICIRCDGGAFDVKSEPNKYKV